MCNGSAARAGSAPAVLAAIGVGADERCPPANSPIPDVGREPLNVYSRPVRLKKTYSSREVASLTGLTARQLQVWHASGLLTPAIAPHRTPAGGYTERRYTPIDLFELLVLAELRNRGFSVQQLHTIIRVLHDRFGLRLFEATGGGGRVRLLTDGRDVYARTDGGDVFSVLRTPAQPLLAIGEDGLLKELGASIRPRRRAKPRAKST